MRQATAAYELLRRSSGKPCSRFSRQSVRAPLANRRTRVWQDRCTRNVPSTPWSHSCTGCCGLGFVVAAALERRWVAAASIRSASRARVQDGAGVRLAAPESGPVAGSRVRRRTRTIAARQAPGQATRWEGGDTAAFSWCTCTALTFELGNLRVLGVTWLASSPRHC